MRDESQFVLRLKTRSDDSLILVHLCIGKYLDDNFRPDTFSRARRFESREQALGFARFRIKNFESELSVEEIVAGRLSASIPKKWKDFENKLLLNRCPSYWTYVAWRAGFRIRNYLSKSTYHRHVKLLRGKDVDISSLPSRMFLSENSDAEKPILLTPVDSFEELSSLIERSDLSEDG